jgi:plastocyanin
MVRFSGYPVKSVALLFLLGITVSACGGDDGNGGTPPPSTEITKNISGSGDAQSGIVGQPLPQPIRVLVSEDGLPTPGVTVTWTSPAAGAELAASSVSDAAGIASNDWTLGTVAGPQTAQAAVTGASGSPVTFNATANAGAAAALTMTGGDQQVRPVNSELPDLLSVKVSDGFGNGVAGVGVDWATTGDAELSATSVTTDATGTSAVGVVLGATEGPITITATSVGLSGSPVTFTATAAPPGPVSANVSVVNNSFQPSSLTVAAGTTVTWTWAPTAVNHNVAPTPPGTEPPGSGPPSSAPDTYSYQFNTPGTYRYFCEVHGSSMSGTIIVQ